MEQQQRKSSTVELSSGRHMPVLGLGTWKGKGEEVEAAVLKAIEVGYRHIDTAMAYGNEQWVGRGIAAAIEKGAVRREELFVTSKLWHTFHRRGRVEEGIRSSLRDLGLEYLDLYLVHWPLAVPPVEGELFPMKDGRFEEDSSVALEETWKGMEEVARKGLARSIGVSNYNHKQLQRMLECAEIPPAVNQVEAHPYFTNEKLVRWCAEKGVHVTAYSPLGSPDRPFAREGEPTLLEDPKIKELAEKKGKTTAQILIRFAIDRGLSVIPKSTTPKRIEENFQVLDFELSEEELNVIRGFEIPHRFCCPMIEENGETIPRDSNMSEFPFNEEF